MSSTRPTSASLGFGSSGYVDAMILRWAQHGSATEPELEESAYQQTTIDNIFRDVLAELPPLQSWEQVIYSRWIVHLLLLWQRSESKAAALSIPTMKKMCSLIETARRYEAESHDHQSRAMRYNAFEVFGVDRRGCSVQYFRPALSDAHSFERELGHEAYCRHMDAFTLFFWDCRYREALASGRHSRIVFVIDCTGYDFSALRRTWSGLATASKWMKMYPGGQGPLDGVRLTLVRNAPAMLAPVFWAIMLMVPSSVREGYKIFSSRSDEAFRQALFEHVDPSQVPRSMGGDCDQHFALDFDFNNTPRK